jgi:peroxiredoxin
MARLAELEQRFSDLEAHLKPSPEREALSLLHAIIHEGWRANRMENNPAGPARSRNVGHPRPGRNISLEDIANLYKSAPPMEGHATSQGLPAGTPAPDFTLCDAEGKEVTLSEYRGHNVVLVFYPLDWSPACSDQLTLYQGELEEFARYDAHVLAISVDSIYSHGAWSAVRELDIPLLADFNPKGEVARRYQVWRARDGFSERALFVVDGEGAIRYTHVSPELHKVPDIYELFERLDGLRRSPTDRQAAG